MLRWFALLVLAWLRTCVRPVVRACTVLWALLHVAVLVWGLLSSAVCGGPCQPSCSDAGLDGGLSSHHQVHDVRATALCLRTAM